MSSRKNSLNLKTSFYHESLKQSSLESSVVTQQSTPEDQPASSSKNVAKDPRELLKVNSGPGSMLNLKTVQTIQSRLAELLAQPPPKAPQPAQKPTQPPIKSLQPAQKPTQPPIKSFQPAQKPTQPPIKSLQPAQKPTQPPIKSLQPAQKPTQPPIKSLQPAQKPTQPPIKSLQLAQMLNQPPIKSLQPTEKLTQPPIKSFQPAQKLSQPPDFASISRFKNFHKVSKTSSLTNSSLNLKTSFYHQPQTAPSSIQQPIPEAQQAAILANKYCTICEQVLTTENLLEHTKNHFQSRTGRCERCSRTFSDYEKFKQHAKKHPRLTITYDTSEDEMIDEPCGSAKKPKQKRTKALEDDDSLFEISEKLPWSDLSGSSDDDDDVDLSRLTWPYTASVDPDFSKPYHQGKICKFCLVNLPYKGYEPHKRDHLNGPFLCEVCGEYFLNYKAFQRHDYKHNDELKCPHCDRRSKCKSSLRCHIAMEHTGKASYTCSTCAKKFFKASHLNNHEKRHRNILNYECEVCNKRFFNSHARKSHMRQHTDEKPFKCKCGEAFRHNVSLKAHQKSRHGINEEKTVPCTECDRKFGSVTAMLTHLRKHPSGDHPQGKRKRKPKANKVNKDETGKSVRSKGKRKKRKKEQSEEEQSEEEQNKD